MMRTMGIDLGRVGAIVILSDESAGNAWPLWARQVDFHRLKPWGLQATIDKLLVDYGVQVVATERPITGRWDPRPGIPMAQRGQQELVKAACGRRDIPVRDYPPRELKKAVVGKGTATKVDMQNHIRALLRLDLGEHVADAAALALLVMNRERTRLKAQSQTRMRLRAGRKARL